jgi:hypothetical protein
MNLLRSICCLIAGRCGVEQPKPTDTIRPEPSVSEPDLGQKEAELEKTGKEQMSHMESGKVSKPTKRRPTKRRTK